MAAKNADKEEIDKDINYVDTLLKEFESWQETSGSEEVFLLESLCGEDGAVTLSMLLSSEHEFRLKCPNRFTGCGVGCFKVEAESSISSWAATLNEYLVGSLDKLSLADVLNKAVSLQEEKNPPRQISEMEEEQVSDSEDEFFPEEDILDDEAAFTTDWDVKVAQKKKRWAQKEAIVREELKKARLSPGETEFGAYKSTCREQERARQIFTSSAASGVLTNDLVRIMEKETDQEFSVEPVDDNIYLWKVKLYNFQSGSLLDKELKEIEQQYGYNYIELELTFDIDLYPFFPPLVKVIRPRLQGALMQRVTNMEILKLSHWSPTKDMKSVIAGIKHFLQQWARLELKSERNDPQKYPQGSYVVMEHHLLRLALVSEVNPRANLRYQMDAAGLASDQSRICPPKVQKMDVSNSDFWAAGTGFGHSLRPEWDINAYLAAQKEKDHQVEGVLHHILHSLKTLYASHAPQLKPRPHRAEAGDVAMATEDSSVNPVEDMYNILEGSALIPFIEQYLRVDSFLEIARHKIVYKAIIDIIKEIAMQPQLLPLVCVMPNQKTSVYHLLEAIEKKATVILHHIGRVGNGSVPKAPRSPPEGRSGDGDFELYVEVDDQDPIVTLPEASHSSRALEERLARDFGTLFRAVNDALKRNGLSPHGPECETERDATTMVIIPTDKETLLETKYRRLLKDLVLDTHEIDLEGGSAHHFAGLYLKRSQPSQNQVFRIAQEITSLSSALPLNLSSSIFVRSDDEKLTLMRALITGPEGTPYSGGCYQFDIFFPSNYPNVPPQVNLQTTGGGTVRFNPNLYCCGKVCLSLLGTWEGQKGEQWNDKTSTVLQVLVSIQSLILVSDPYFNEPGFEQEIGTLNGKKHSDQYNAEVRINNIRYAMVGQLHNPTPGFEEVIQTHFYLKKEKILKETAEWLKECKSHHSKLERAIQNLKQELAKLKPPSNLTNLSSPRSSPNHSSNPASPKNSSKS